MRSMGRRAWFLLGLGAIAVPLVATALAYGCTAAATLSASPGAAAAGSTVTVTGKYFGTHDPEDVTSNPPVQLRLGSVTGPVLANAAPAGTDRAFTVQFTIPSGTPAGDTFISATQLSATGTPVYGTPARQAFRVTAAPAASGAPGPSGQPVAQEVAARRLATLSMASARRKAKSAVLRRNRRAKAIRTRCARRSRTTVACLVRYRVGSKSYSRRVVVRSTASAASW